MKRRELLKQVGLAASVAATGGPGAPVRVSRAGTIIMYF